MVKNIKIEAGKSFFVWKDEGYLNVSLNFSA